MIVVLLFAVTAVTCISLISMYLPLGDSSDRKIGVKY